MKILIEKETISDGEKSYSLVKEITKTKDAKKGDWIHVCYHDEEFPRPCRRFKK